MDRENFPETFGADWKLKAEVRETKLRPSGPLVIRTLWLLNTGGGQNKSDKLFTSKHFDLWEILGVTITR